MTPESGLQEVLENLRAAVATSSPNARARKNAFRWFNRLYYDVRTWNESFTRFLDTYPGFRGSASASEYGEFLRELSEYRESLHERYGTAKGDLCTNLKVLSLRYSKDFRWLYEEDEDLYRRIRSLVDDAYATEDSIISIASYVCNMILRSVDPDWHREHYSEIVRDINDYKEASRMEVAAIKRMTDDVGIHLLDMNEYEETLNSEGSTNPNVMVIGEVTMSQDEIHIQHVVGPVNVKSRLDRVTQVVQAAPSVSEEQKRELSALMEELKQALQPATDSQPEDSQRVVQAAELVAAEVAKERPSKSFLNITTEGLIEAARAVAGIAPTVLNVAAQIATVVGTIA